jgi:c-di-GMP-binding flagellar brake protein YcgR
MRWFSRPPDRRRSKRFKADVRVIITLVGTTDVIPLRAHGVSISEAGFSALGLSTLTVGDRVTLELDIPVATTRHIWVDAIVRRSGEPCALEFLSLTDDQRELIKRYCRLQPEEKRRR